MHFTLCLPWYMWQPFQAFISSKNFHLSLFLFSLLIVSAACPVLCFACQYMSLIFWQIPGKLLQLESGCELKVSLCTSPSENCQTGQNTQLQYFRSRVQEQKLLSPQLLLLLLGMGRSRQANKNAFFFSSISLVAFLFQSLFCQFLPAYDFLVEGPVV